MNRIQKNFTKKYMFNIQYFKSKLISSIEPFGKQIIMKKGQDSVQSLAALFSYVGC